MCKQKFGRLPRIGYEMTIDEGTVQRGGLIRELDGSTTKSFEGMRPHKYETYLQNIAGAKFRVWTHVDVVPTFSEPSAEATARADADAAKLLEKNPLNNKWTA